MKIVIGSDKSGFKLKEAVKEYLKEQDFLEIGTTDPDSGPVLVVRSGQTHSDGQSGQRILICRTGMGWPRLPINSGRSGRLC